MPADSNIFQQYLQAPKSIIDYQTQYNQADAAKNALAQSALAVQKGQMDLSNAADVNRQRNALRAAVTSGQLDLSNPAHAQQALAIAPDVAPALLKTVQESATSRALAGKDTAQAGHFDAQTDAEKVKTRIAKADDAIKDIAAFKTPQDALASLQRHVAAGDVTPDKAQLIQSTMPQDPAQFPGWQLKMLQNIMAAKDQIALTVPDANTTQTNATRVQTTGMTNATTRRGQDLTNSRALETQNIEKVKADPFGTLGLNTNVAPAAQASAGLTGDAYLATLPPGVAAQVKGIADGTLQISPRTLQSPQGAALVQMAMQYEPGTDQTTYQKRNATAKDAASGNLAKSNNALNTVAGHLADLKDAADALNNTRFPLYNRAANAVADATGDPRIKAFQLNAQGVASELERAYRGAGGSERDIQEWRSSLNAANSPDQFDGVLKKASDMLQSKLEANQAQYEQGMAGRAGNYSAITPKAAAAFQKLRGSAAPTASGVPPDIAAILDKHK